MIQELEVKLNKKNIRSTAMRLLVLEVLLGQKAAISLPTWKNLSKNQTGLRYTVP